MSQKSSIQEAGPVPQASESPEGRGLSPLERDPASLFIRGLCSLISQSLSLGQQERPVVFLASTPQPPTPARPSPTRMAAVEDSVDQHG